MINKPLTSYINLGPGIVSNLKKVDIHTLDDIRTVGPVGVYLRLKKKYPKKVWPVCYYLYSLQGALTDTYWDDISERNKKELLRAIGR